MCFSNTSLLRRDTHTREIVILFGYGDNNTCATEKRRDVRCPGTPVVTTGNYKKYVIALKKEIEGYAKKNIHEEFNEQKKKELNLNYAEKSVIEKKT